MCPSPNPINPMSLIDRPGTRLHGHHNDLLTCYGVNLWFRRIKCEFRLYHLASSSRNDIECFANAMISYADHFMRSVPHTKNDQTPLSIRHPTQAFSHLGSSWS